MYYSAIGILALLILIIVNQDVFKRADKEMYKRKDELKMMKKSTI